MIKELIQEIKGDRSIEGKKKAIYKNKAKKRLRCTGNMTPHLVRWNGNQPVYKCTVKDIKKSLKIKQLIRKIKNQPKFKKARLKAQDTKKFRYGK